MNKLKNELYTLIQLTVILFTIYPFKANIFISFLTYFLCFDYNSEKYILIKVVNPNWTN